MDGGPPSGKGGSETRLYGIVGDVLVQDIRVVAGVELVYGMNSWAFVLSSSTQGSFDTNGNPLVCHLA